MIMKMQIWLGVAVVAVICGGAELRANASEEADVLPYIQFVDVGLSTGVETLAKQASLNPMFDPHWLDGLRATNSNRSFEPILTFAWTNITAADALARLLKEHGLFAVLNPQTGVTRITSSNCPPREFDKDFIGTVTNGVLPQIRLMSMTVQDCVESLAKPSNLKVVIGSIRTPGDYGMYIRWEKLTARQAIAALCENNNLQITRETNVWRISQP
jgi:hypothetical protein